MDPAEEEVFLPIAERVLAEADWEEIGAAFRENDNPLFGIKPKEEAEALYQRILNLAPPPMGFGTEPGAEAAQCGGCPSAGGARAMPRKARGVAPRDGKVLPRTTFRGARPGGIVALHNSLDLVLRRTKMDLCIAAKLSAFRQLAPATQDIQPPRRVP
jgi:hypothetical protein